MRALLAALCLGLVTVAAMADENPHALEEGVGIVCDTPAQIERFAQLGGKPDALKAVNIDAGRPVCAFAPVRYIRGREVGRVRLAGRASQIVEILLIEVNVRGRWGEVTPELQYTLFAVDEDGA
jgi:hypothetical protein